MNKCKCSERPLAVISTDVVMEENVPYQVLLYACTNKKCSEYKKPKYRQKINLLDTSKTTIEPF